MPNVNVNSRSIVRSLNKFKPLQAFCEYIWNGFDASASRIDIHITENELGGYGQIEISDNGTGIVYAQLSRNFGVFNDSEKSKITRPQGKHFFSFPHGKNGIGRFTFSKFADKITWKTTYYSETELCNKTYTISMSKDSLNSYELSDETTTAHATGTTVFIEDVFLLPEFSVIKNYLSTTFCWFLKLNEQNTFQIFINGEPIVYDNLIASADSFSCTFQNSNIAFDTDFVQWNQSVGNEEHSKFYFLNSQGSEVFKINTNYNHKGDDFFHSLYIKSSLFDNFSVTDEENSQNLFEKNLSSDEYKYILQELRTFLAQKRKPFLQGQASNLIEHYKKNNILPRFNSNDLLDSYKEQYLIDSIEILYSYKPALFKSLSAIQQKTFVRFLNEILDTKKREDLFIILDDVLALKDEERCEFREVLAEASLSNIIKMTKLVRDRLKAIAELKLLVFDKELEAYEVPHLQTFIENHYWIFGERYHLVTAAEPKFEEALRRYQHILTGDDEKKSIDHPDKNKEMDIFAIRQSMLTDSIENLVVELKRPTIVLGEKELGQVKRYLSVIKSEPQFNASNMSWTFILVGTKYNDYIKEELSNAKNHGEAGLVFKVGNAKIYVKTWSEIITELELRMNFLSEKLDLQLKGISNNDITADSIVDDAVHNNTAVAPAEHII